MCYNHVAESRCYVIYYEIFTNSKMDRFELDLFFHKYNTKQDSFFYRHMNMSRPLANSLVYTMACKLLKN